jgi:hypothetical protein
VYFYDCILELILFLTFRKALSDFIRIYRLVDTEKLKLILMIKKNAHSSKENKKNHMHHKTSVSTSDYASKFYMDAKKEMPLKYSFLLKFFVVILFALSLILIGGGIFLFDNSMRIILTAAGVLSFVCSLILLREIFAKE